MRIRLSLALLVTAVLACSMHASPAEAQRVFVSATGSDGNPCSFASPCRSFQHAHDVAPAHGEIDVLDPAGYGSVTINKAISIQGHGFSGITVASGASGITINAGSSDAITLNGLIIDGAHAGYNGIVFNAGGGLTVNDCVAQNFVSNGANNTGNGIFIAPSSGTVVFAITNTVVVNNDMNGIYYNPPSGSPSANGAIDHVVATRNFIGIQVDTSLTTVGSTVFAISNSIASNNTEGIATVSGSGILAVSVDSTNMSGNFDSGIYAVSGRVLLGRSVIMGNFIGVNNATSNTFFTYKDNRISGNFHLDITSPLNSTVALQ
jgi:hypothetical protein